jgi:hypothetical protein
MVNLAEAFPKGTVGSREVKAAYFATQTPHGIECCCFLCIDECAITFPAEMGYKASRAFGPGGGKIDVGKIRCRGRFAAFGLKGSEGLNDCFVAEAVEAQAEVALRLQK